MAELIPDATQQPSALTRYSTLGFALLWGYWFVSLCWPSLQQRELMHLAEDTALTLMAAVILLAVHAAWYAGERGNAVVFCLSELLYCSAY